jgi:mRNA interferase HigB
MHIISRKTLVDFWSRHPPAKRPMEAWHKAVECASWSTVADIRHTFNSADKAVIHFNRNKVYLRHVFTHTEYESWNEQQRKRSRK